MGRGLSHRLLERDIPSYRRAAAGRYPPLAPDNSNAGFALESDRAEPDTAGPGNDVVVVVAAAAADLDTVIRLIDLGEGRVDDGQEVGVVDIAPVQLRHNWTPSVLSRHRQSL